MAISSNHIQSNSGQLYTVHMAFAAADCSAEGTVSIIKGGLDVHGGAAAGGLLLLLRLVASLRTAVHEHRRDLEKCSYA